MEDGPAVPPLESQDSGAVERLAARVAQLELEVAALSRTAYGSHPAPAGVAGAPPPPLPRFASGLSIQPGSSAVQSGPAASQTQVAPPVGTSTVAAELQAATPQKSLEDRLGSQLFNFIGIVALIFGAAWALKLAIEEGWIGIAGRVIVGLAAGAGLVLWSEIFRRRNLAAFSYTLKAVGTGVLYLSLWAGFQLYHLLPAPAALAAMILVTAWNAFMAFTQDAELLAAYALVGGLLTPVLLSTGGDHETFLFTYIAAIVAGVIVLLRAKPWPRLLPPAFLGMAGYFIGYYTRFFHAARVTVWDAQSTETALFAILFAGLFALVSTRLWSPPEQKDGGILLPVLIPLANATFLSLALYSVFEDSGLHDSLAFLMVALAAVFLGLMRLQKTSLAAAMHLAAAVVFLTVAIPLKASGQTLTTAWLVEGLILFWASTRFEAEQKAPSRALALLSAAGYALGLASVLFHWTWSYGALDRQPFLNANLGSALVAVATLAGAAWICYSNSTAGAEPAGKTEDLPVLLAALAAIAGVGILLILRELTSDAQSIRFSVAAPTAFFNAGFATSLVGLCLLAAVSWTGSKIFALERSRYEPFRLLAAVSLVLFNLLAILCVEGEIGRLFTAADAALERSLAISAFLMLYAAVLLAAGFWRRNAFVRWQALLLILFTIAKVFLYDISGLSAGYRVVSFLALGALLLTVSFAYQKDWLGLKTPRSTPGDSA